MRGSTTSGTSGSMYASCGVETEEAPISCTQQLARFFPGAVPAQFPVQVTALRPGAAQLTERTLVEFSTDQHAIFLCSLPLEFDDRVRLERNGGRLKSEASGIAIRYEEGRKAVAVRLQGNSRNWKAEP